MMNGQKFSDARTRDILPMSVDNMTFLVDRLAQDCAPLQFMRELTVNSIQAIALTEKQTGTIIWDVDWFYHELTSVYKLCCIDTGIGMTGPEMVEYINKLSSSIHEQAASKNFGIGAKISAAPRNRHGLIYRSWKDGRGSMIELYFDQDHQLYGLKRWAKNNGEFWTHISEDLKPDQIDNHGTVVTLTGDSPEQDTMRPPTGTPMPSRWAYRYLNTRFYQFPPGVVLKAREGWELPRANTKHNFLRTIEPQGNWLARNHSRRGTVDLSDAKASWWILKSECDADGAHNAPGGHVAALFQNELYEMFTGRAGIARLQAFGVVFGAGRVVIYVEPLGERVMANTARTHLLIDRKPLEWSRWASEFRERLPDELISLQDEISARTNEKDHRKAILERLKYIHDLLRFSRFQATKNGSVPLGDGNSVRGNREASRQEKPETPDPDRKPAQKRGRRADVFALFAEAGPSSGEAIAGMQEPETIWISEQAGSRTPPDLDDRAAKFLIERNLIMINADFRVFCDMVERWRKAYAHLPGTQGVIKEVVHEWFEQELIETVMGALALHKAGGMNWNELSELWSETSLTAAVLARYHIDQSIRRHLGQQLGSLKSAA
jgi:hypothetical protein